MRLQQIKPIKRRIGNSTADKRPVLRLSFNERDTNPTVAGPREQTVSPAKARRANIAVPPFGHFSEAKLYVPGHIAPTENPHIPQPSSDTIAIGDNEAKR